MASLRYLIGIRGEYLDSITQVSEHEIKLTQSVLNFSSEITTYIILAP